MREIVKTIVAVFLLGIIGFCVHMIPTARTAYIESQPIEEITVYAQKRPIITWQLYVCRNLVKHPDGRVKIGKLGTYLDCRDKELRRVIFRTDI